MHDVFAAILMGASLVAVVVGLYLSQRARQARRAAYLATYPTVDHLLAVLDRDKYRAMRDRHGRTGNVHAARAVQRDYPGIKPNELAEVVSKL